MPDWPAGTKPARFDEDQHPRQAHDLLLRAYRYGGGHVDSFDAWWRALREDPEYHPSVFFLAIGADGAVIGLAQCWISAFLKDLAVAESWRRKGVGKALLLQAFTTFKEREATQFDLKVENDNLSKAERLYRRLGMIPIT